MSSYGRYGLTKAAFAPEDNREIYVESEAHRRALAHLRHGLKQGEGIVIITGDDGCGKSTVLNRLAAETENEQVQALVFDAASLDETHLEEDLLNRLGASKRAVDVGLADVLVERREAGQRYAVLFDNAEAFSDTGLEAVRQLSVMFHDGDALLQIALAGDTPMRSILYKANMDRFRQRVIASYHIPALTKDETVAYVAGRVTASGGDVDRAFSKAALEALAKWGEGNPGRINALAHRAIGLAAARDNDHVAGKDVNAAADGLQKAPVKAPAPETVAAAPVAPVAAAPAKADSVTVGTTQGTATPKFVPPRIVPTNPVERINGNRAVNVVPPAPKKPALSPDQINAAIENMGTPGASAQPEPARKRTLSPQELMMARPSTPLVAAPEAVSEKPAQAVKLPPAPKPEGDLWDPAAEMSSAEVERLDALSFEAIEGQATLTPEVQAFLSDAREKLDSLRGTLKALREETDRLDGRRREMREKIRGRIDSLGERLDDLAQER